MRNNKAGLAKYNSCKNCDGQSFISISTYKRFWHVCIACGDARPIQRERYPLRWLPYDDLKKQIHLDEAKMYDYFTTDIHVKLAIEEAQEFHERFVSPKGLPLKGKSLLDISGGNGHFAKWYADSFSMSTSFTEINQSALDYARKHHGFDRVEHYDLNKDNLFDKVGRKFDVVMGRACIMFCDELSAFARQLLEITNPGGLVIIDRSTEPTLGTLVRVQLDEFSYHILRQPNTVEQAFRDAGFDVMARHDETDPSLYVYDHDLLPHWKWIHYIYEIKGLQALDGRRVFNLPARDRRRTTFFFRAPI
ncbi:methyltransferase domain-containing protein [Roseicyclus marinus]|uniref:methyltransferase domain-containing protein n=1 Tax=Roseicyclus marinus TaxID=2161673 RepID=UPI0024109570|nr:class I SAM-dependent methyltransferase [Roseicyclus marinus]MDG3042452.1 class I SAM-dependent methyltransferase [Roseicyclus marinus]